MPEFAPAPTRSLRRLSFVAVVLFLTAVCGWGASSDDFHAALDSFTGEWSGEIRVHALDGYLLKTFPAKRTYSWENGQQIAETRFSDGSQPVVFRDVRSVQRGRLHLLVERPGMPEEEFGGELGEGGIIWTNVQRNNRDLKERILTKGETSAIEASSVEVMRLTGISGLVRVSMSFESADGRALAGSNTGAEISRLEKQIEDLETQLSQAGSRDPALAEELAASNSRAEELAARISDLETENATMAKTLEESGTKALEAATLAATVAKLEKENAAAERNLEDLRRRLDASAETAGDVGALRRERDELSDQLVASTTALASARIEAGGFSERVEELTEVIREAKAANDAATRQIADLDRTLLDTRNEIETLRTEALGVAGERDALAAQLDAARTNAALASQNASATRELERQLASLQADRDEQMARAAELAGLLEAERADAEKLRSGADAESIQVDQLRREIADARGELESRDADLSRTRAQLAAAEKERGELAVTAVTIQELTGARDRAITESSDLSRKLQVVEAELTAMRSSAGSESARTEQVQAQLVTMTAGLEAQSNEVARLNARLAALESRPDITSEALDLERRENQRRYEQAEGGRLEAIGRLAEVEAELKPLRDDLALRDRQLAEFKQTLASLEGTSGALDDVRAKVRELEAAREAERVRHAAESDSNRAQIVALEQNVDELKSTETELGALKSLAGQRQKDNENLVRHIDTLTVERAQLVARVSALETTIAKAPSTAVASDPVESSRAVFAQGDDLADRVERLERRVIELESERNSLRNREEILEAQLKEASDLRDGTLSRFQDLVSQLNAIRSERDRLARANVSLESDLRAAQSQRTLVKSETPPPAEEGGLLSRIISMGSEDSSGSSREVDRTIASYEIIGVTASEAGDKAILNGRVYHGGDVVDVNLGIVFKRIDGDALVFNDDQGREYRRRF